MREQQPGSHVILFALIASTISCDAVDRARTRFGKTTTDTVVTATGSGLSLGLHVPPALRPGDEGVLRLSLNNLTDTAVTQVRLELIVPGWAEAMPPRVGDRPVTLSALGDGTTQFAYQMHDAPLESKRVQTVEQRIRVPASGATASAGGSPSLVRARLLTADGRPLAQVESQIIIDSTGSVSGAPKPNVRGAVISVGADRGGSAEGPIVSPAAPQHLVVDDCTDLVLFQARDTSSNPATGVVILTWTEPQNKQRSLTILGRSRSCAAHEGVKRILQPAGG